MVLKILTPSRALAGFALAALAAATHAQTNLDFETGDFTGWSRIGDTFVLGANLGTGPSQGSFDALLATATDGTVNSAVHAGSGVSGAAAESALGLTGGALSGIGNGTALLVSGIAQSISLAAGQTVSFDWDFLTNQTYFDGSANSIAPDASNNDFGFVSTSKSGASHVSVLADTFYGYALDASSPAGFDSGFSVTDVRNPFVSETKFHRYSFTAASAGDYLIGFGVAHATQTPDNGINSALLIDNVQVTPEPSSMIALGGLCVAMLRSRRKSRK